MGGFWNEKRLARTACAVLLLVIAAYGTWLRSHDLGISLYDDEISTRERAQQTVLYTLESRNYPLYYLLAKASLTLGDTEEALRLPSFLAGIATIFVAFGLVRRVHSSTAGLVAAALIAFSPFHIHYSTFARYYALMMLFALLTLWALHALLERDRARYWLAYTAAAFLALSSHVCFAPALALMNVMAALYLLCNRARGPLRHRAALIALLALCTITASGFMIEKNVHPGRMFKKADVPAASAADAPSKNANGATASTEPAPAATATKVAKPPRPLGGGLATTDAATGKTRYRLTYYDCIEYLKSFFWNNTPWLWPLLLVLGAAGLADLWFRVPALAAPLTGGLLLAPIPMFFFTASHWYHVRYLSYGAVFAVILVACGTCVLPRFVARLLTAPRSIRLWRHVPVAAGGRTINATNILYFAFIAALAVPMAPIMNEAYLTYPVDGYLPRGPLVQNHAPIRDWQTLHRFTAAGVREGDHFLFMTPEDEHGAEYTRYYFSRFLNWNEEERRFRDTLGPATPKLIRQLAQDYPMANLWFVGFQNYNVRDFVPLFEAAGALQLDLSSRNIPKGLRLFFLGAPTVNHIENGGFESRFPDALPEGVYRRMGAGYDGPAALEIEMTPEETGGKKSWQRMYRSRVKPAVYRLRNNAFEAWRKDAPTGWVANHFGAISPSDSGIENSRCLKLAPATETTVLQQGIAAGLAPGHTLSVQAQGLSHTPDNLQLVLRYAGPGFQEEVRCAHPGSGEWAEMKLEAAIPATTDPNSITVELWRMPGGVDDALLDNVDVKVTDAGDSLDPGTPYVLSLAVRTEGLRHQSGAEMIPAARARLSWKDENGKSGRKDLMLIHNDENWRRLTAIVRPGRDLPTNLAELYFEIGIVDGTGKIQIDQVQLETGTQPSPFTYTDRLPHDETIPLCDLDPHAVSVSW